MQIFENADGQSFKLNSVKYVKNFIVMPVGSDSVAVLNAYDTKLQLLSATHYSQIKVNNASFPNRQTLIDTLAPMVFAKVVYSDGILSNELISIPEIVRVGNQLTIAQGAIWRIDGVVLSSQVPFETTINLATVGFNRIDIIVAKTDGTFEKIQGAESENVATAPLVPSNSLFVTSINIIGDSISDGQTPIVGDSYVKKADLGEVLFYMSGFNVTSASLDGECGGIRFLGDNPTFESIFFYNYQNLYQGKRFRISNSQNNNLVIKHNTGIAGHKFHIPNNQDLVLNPNEIVEFALNITSEMTGRLEYIGKLNQGSGGSDITYTSQLFNDGDDTINPFVSAQDVEQAMSNLAQVSITGQYSDLLGLPVIPTLPTPIPQVNSDWNAMNGVSAILNKPNIITPTGLGRLQIDGRIGYRLIGQNETYFGGIGQDAIDLSLQDTVGNFGATGNETVALGFKSTASAIYSTAVGRSALASGYASTSLGNGSNAAGTNATAIGRGAIASANNTLSIGDTSSASGVSAIAIGGNSASSGEASLSIGYGSSATKRESNALGRSAKALGNYSTALGSYSTAKSFQEVALGSYGVDYTPISTSVFNAQDRVFSVANGRSTALRSDALVILKNGLATLPSVTNTMITEEVSGKAIATKEFVIQTINEIPNSANSSLQNVLENESEAIIDKVFAIHTSNNANGRGSLVLDTFGAKLLGESGDVQISGYGVTVSTQGQAFNLSSQETNISAGAWGSIRMNSTDGMSFNSAAGKLKLNGAGGGVSIDGGGFGVTIDGGDGIILAKDIINYDTNKSSDYTDRTLVDKAYVDSLISSTPNLTLQDVLNNNSIATLSIPAPFKISGANNGFHKGEIQIGSSGVQIAGQAGYVRLSGDAGGVIINGGNGVTIDSGSFFRLSGNGNVIEIPATPNEGLPSMSLIGNGGTRIDFDRADSSMIDLIAPQGINFDTVGKVKANSDIEITDFTKGLILTSENGNKFRIIVSNDGSLTTSLI